MVPKTIILITGANSGIGYDTSYALAAASPYNHVILACRSASRGAQALNDLRTRNPAGVFTLLELDITKDDSIAAAVTSLTTQFGVIDVLINNAGIIITEPKDPRSDLLATFNTNVISTVIVTEALLPLLQKSKDPRIINVSSNLGSITERGNPSFPYYGVQENAYRMSKAALNMATVNMHVAYHKAWGAKVWSYCPGYVVTNLTGSEDRETRVKQGAESSETSAVGLVEIVEGKRDAEIGKFLTKYGQRWDW